MNNTELMGAVASALEAATKALAAVKGQKMLDGLSLESDRLVAKWSDGTQQELFVFPEPKAGRDGVSVVGAALEDGVLRLALSDGNFFEVGNVQGPEGKPGADGKDGAEGPAGVGLVDAKLGLGGCLILTTSDGVVHNLGPVLGERGLQGEQGPQGEAGRGVASAELKDSNLILMLTDGSILNLGCVKGERGEPGSNGRDGRDGADGVGVVSALLESDSLILMLSDGTKHNLGNVQGPQGARGADGLPGADGKDGAPGVGIVDMKLIGDDLHVYLSDGGTVFLAGMRGPRGDDGLPGRDGTDGASGADGRGIATLSINGEGELSTLFTDGTYAVLGKVIGPVGPQGDQGPRGERGEPGEAGLDGRGVADAKVIGGRLVLMLTDGQELDVGTVHGEAGKDGRGIAKVNWLNNELSFDLTDGSSIFLGNLKGEAGAAGRDGRDGAEIHDAEVSADGLLTITLSNNRVIKAGKVLQGPKGEDGRGIAGAALESDSLVLTLTDGTKLDLGNIRGAKGERGERGERGIQGLMGPAGRDGENGLDGRGISNLALESGKLVAYYTDGSAQEVGKVPAGGGGGVVLPMAAGGVPTKLQGLPQADTDEVAATLGLTTGDLYRTTDGTLKVKL